MMCSGQSYASSYTRVLGRCDVVSVARLLRNGENFLQYHQLTFHAASRINYFIDQAVRDVKAKINTRNSLGANPLEDEFQPLTIAWQLMRIQPRRVCDFQHRRRLHRAEGPRLTAGERRKVDYWIGLGHVLDATDMYVDERAFRAGGLISERALAHQADCTAQLSIPVDQEIWTR
jgi:hypothetical protein